MHGHMCFCNRGIQDAATAKICPRFVRNTFKDAATAKWDFLLVKYLSQEQRFQKPMSRCRPAGFCLYPESLLCLIHVFFVSACSVSDWSCFFILCHQITHPSSYSSFMQSTTLSFPLTTLYHHHDCHYYLVVPHYFHVTFYYYHYLQ